jgi:hypothetical protein
MFDYRETAAMALDRKSEASTVATPLYLCHGGSHAFTLKADEHSPWVNQEVSLNSPPSSTLPLSASPALGDFHKFEEGGAVWTINCPPKGPDAPVDSLQFWVQTEHTSPAYKVDASLGHHRLVLDDVIGGEQFQVLEYGEQAELKVLETSYYTKGAAGVSALWKLGTQDITWAEPDPDGWVRHTFTPPTPGVYPLSVTAPSLYFEEGVVRKEVSVHALALTPWGNDAVLELNGEPVVDVIDRGVVLKRGQPYTLKLLNENLLLKGSTIALMSDVTGLGLIFDPKLGEARTVEAEEMTWSISSGSGQPGPFTLKVVCSRLKKDWEVTGHLISESMADVVARVEVNNQIISDLGALFFRDETRPLTLTFNPAMRGLWVMLEEVGGAELGMRYSPALKTLIQVPENLKVSWQVTGGQSSGAFSLQVLCPDMAQPFSIQARVFSNIAKEIRSFTAGGGEVDLEKLELVFFPGGNSISIKFNLDSPLIGMTSQLLLSEPNDELGLIFRPPIETHKKIPLDGWIMFDVETSASSRGFFGLHLRIVELDLILPLSCRVMSKLVRDELEAVMVDGQPVSYGDQDIGPLFRPGKTHRLTLVFSELMKGIEVVLSAINVPATVEPVSVVTVPESLELTWDVSNNGVSCRFPLDVQRPGFGTTLIMCRVMSDNMADEVEWLQVDGKDYDPHQPNVEFKRGVESNLKMEFKKGPQHWGGPMHGLIFVFIPFEGDPDPELVFTPPLGQESDFGKAPNFSVTGATKPSTFNLKLSCHTGDIGAEMVIQCKQL